MLEREISNSVFPLNSGKNRRQKIINLVMSYQKSNSHGLPVNNKYQWSTKDKDIKVLLKKGNRQ